MKLNRRDLRRLIESVLNESSLPPYYAGPNSMKISSSYTFTPEKMYEQSKTISRDAGGNPLIAADATGRGDKREYVIDKNALDKNDNIVIDVFNANRGTLSMRLLAINGKPEADFKNERFTIRLKSTKKDTKGETIPQSRFYDPYEQGIAQTVVYDGATGLGGGAESLKAGNTHTISILVA